MSVCHIKRFKRSTDRNPPPIFTKLATEVESRLSGDALTHCFGGNPKDAYAPIYTWWTHVGQTGSGINFHHRSYGKIALMSIKYLENGDKYHGICGQ